MTNFIDRVVIEVRSGKGGDGVIAFLHEKFISKGGPSGGNGGRGASIILRANKSVNTLFNFRYSKVIIGQDGEKGGNKNMYGRAAKDIYVDVPIGTVVYEENTNKVVADLNEDGKEVVVAKGGRGGRGNSCFKSSRNKVPRVAENGLPGEKKRLIMELKLLADVGLVGFPSVGKSTLLSVVSNARPEIADYPFTTIIPNLGIVSVDNFSSFVLADLPGLIEGASEGKGLGTTFLRHIERCKVLVHVVSMDGERDAYSDYNVIMNELESYKLDLAKRPMVIVASKMDEEGAQERLEVFKKQIGKDVLPISALTHEGIDELMYKCNDLVKNAAPINLFNDEEEKYKVYDAYEDNKKIFDIVKEKEHVWRIIGDGVVRTYNLINISTDEGMLKLISYLRKIGVDERLQELGAQDGDDVYLCDFAFEYIS